jgi:hypothetical protein
MRELTIKLDDKEEFALELLKDLSVNYEFVMKNALMESAKALSEEGVDDFIL